jgi:hypothetical protein
MMRRLCALALLSLLAAPLVAAAEDYTVYPLGDRWHLVVLHALVTLPTPAGQWATRVTVGLDDIPGGLDSVPAWTVYAMGDRASVDYTVSLVNFHPTVYSHYAPDVTLLIRNDSGRAQTYRVKIHVRGKE